MAFRIIADSSCDIFDLDRKIDGLYFNTVPFVITVDGRDFVDDDKLDVKELVEAMAASSKSHTSCPSPADWVREFGEEGDVFALTISSNLSGSYNSACTARNMVLENDPERNIEILDTRGTGPSLSMTIDKLCDLIGQGLSFEEVRTQIHKFMEDHKLIFALSSYHNLVNNGRMPKIAGIVLGHLGLWQPSPFDFEPSAITPYSMIAWFILPIDILLAWAVNRLFSRPISRLLTSR